MKVFKYLFITVFGLIYLFSNNYEARAQVTISPTFVFMNDQNRFGTMLVMNGSQQAQEISIEYLFGYPDSDDSGNIYMNYGDSAAARQYSMEDWIRGFPQNFTLQPGQRQVVRFIARPPSDLSDGVYWTRIQTSSSPLSPPVDATSEENVSAQISINLKQVTTALYQAGDVSTGVTINNIQVDVGENPPLLRYTIDKEGNAPFLGSNVIEITNSNGERVYYNRSTVSVFFDLNRTVELGIDDLPSGTYELKLSYMTQRSDIAKDELVQSGTVTKTHSFTIR